VPTAPAATAPLLLVGETPGGPLDDLAWTQVPDPGPEGAALAAALRPCLEAAGRGGDVGAGFRDFLNHEMRTPLTAAGTALQTLALHMERAGGPSLELVDVAMRNLRRLEQTVDWACDYLTVSPDEVGDPDTGATALTDLLLDLDELDPPAPLSWATGAGDWDAAVPVDRPRWRRFLRQVLRALAHQAPGKPLHLELSTHPGNGSAGGLLLVFQLPTADGHDRVQRTGTHDEAEQLRRLLSFTVHPDLARQLGLRVDVVRLSQRLRLRLMLPLANPAGEPVGV
jgi:signal transduction histidine kinase